MVGKKWMPLIILVQWLCEQAYAAWNEKRKLCHCWIVVCEPMNEFSSLPPPSPTSDQSYQLSFWFFGPLWMVGKKWMPLIILVQWLCEQAYAAWNGKRKLCHYIMTVYPWCTMYFHEKILLHGHFFKLFNKEDGWWTCLLLGLDIRIWSHFHFDLDTINLH